MRPNKYDKKEYLRVISYVNHLLNLSERTRKNAILLGKPKQLLAFSPTQPMAKLTIHNLTLEIIYDSVRSGWINYAVYFKWNGFPVINQNILRAGRTRLGKADALWANDDHETLISTIEEVLEKREPAYWQSLEPDLSIGFYPGWVFPFTQTYERVPADISNREYYELLRKGEFVEAEHQMKRMDHSIDKETIQVIAKVDTNNFTPGDEPGYGSEGISLHMVVQDWQLYDFLKELKQEYDEFFLKHQDELTGEE